MGIFPRISIFITSNTVCYITTVTGLKGSLWIPSIICELILCSVLPCFVWNMFSCQENFWLGPDQPFSSNILLWVEFVVKTVAI